MTNKDQKIITKLEKHANEFLKKEFNLTLEIPIKISGRLKRAAGMYSYLYDEYSKKITPQKIQIARFAVENNTMEDVIDALEHELVHYALCIRGEKFHDEDLNFINTCKRLGIPLSHNYKSEYKIFKCEKCGKIIKEATNISNKYIHKNCGGKFELIGTELLRASEKPTIKTKADEKPQKTTTKKLQNQKSKHTTELLKDLNLKELK
jgi:SprT-like protein